MATHTAPLARIFDAVQNSTRGLDFNKAKDRRPLC